MRTDSRAQSSHCNVEAFEIALQTIQAILQLWCLQKSDEAARWELSSAGAIAVELRNRPGPLNMSEYSHDLLSQDGTYIDNNLIAT